MIENHRSFCDIFVVSRGSGHLGSGFENNLFKPAAGIHSAAWLVTRTADTVDQFADIADAIVEATRAPAFQIAEVTRAMQFKVQTMQLQSKRS